MMKPTTKFNYLKKQNPYWSSWVCFAIAIVGQKISKMSLCRLFNSLVQKGDYVMGERDEIIEYCVKLTNENPSILPL